MNKTNWMAEFVRRKRDQEVSDSDGAQSRAVALHQASPPIKLKHNSP